MHTESLIDMPTAVRAGEELDIERLAGYLHQHLDDVRGPLGIEQFPGGFSNLTYLLRLGDPSTGSGPVREMVLRRPPFGANVRGGHDMGREFRILGALVDSYGKVPRPLLYCGDESVLGAPFYVMERVRGVILRNRPPQGLKLGADLMRRICLSLVDALVELHAIDTDAAGLGELGKPEGYTARQVAGWTKRYQNALTDDCPDFEPVAGWLAEHVPPRPDATLIHNDFRYDNAILAPEDLTRIVAILDWEMATLGDPLTDVGTTLAYWAEPEDPAVLRQFGLTAQPGNLDRGQLLDRYAERSGRDVSGSVFYYLYGVFKNAVIALQIYARYRQGLTRDPRFGGLIEVIRAYHDMAQRALDRGRMSHLFS
jgi:aminoglycoside phosphotransferase (APT) family kinase protein